MLCVTNRPHLLDALLDGVARQSHPITELVIVTNAAAFDDVDVAAAATTRGRDLPPVTVLERAPSVSLGACLNAAIDATDARFVAKFDDDDVYGPHYLADSMRAHAYAGAAVVGKHTYYAYLAEQDRTVLRFPTHEFSYSSTLAGGTLVIDRDRIGSVRFADVSIGEDRAFIAACLRRGAATFSADRFSFTQTRSGDNTWNVDLERFLIGTTPVQSGNAADVVDL